MSSTEGSGECCKKVSSCAVFLFFMFITFVLLHVLFLTVVQFKMATFMFMGTLFVCIKHCSFGLENTIVASICICQHFLWRTCMKIIWLCRWVCN
ncbi:hypothetical protein AB205_0173270 [Aquarana catesbeiana]|uniref:Uncharacterized protein n=1 Tax=Aquarana catesbeiana TaxID=8400 RepID=A0A2G9Q6W6_AQUCT|nr:hypothetical protein AB205_0173270 [Aquarana catesbeiana]